MTDSFAARSMERKNVKGLVLDSTRPNLSSASSNNNSNNDDQKFDWDHDSLRPEEEVQLGIRTECNLDIKREDLEVVQELGSGNGGTVSKVKHLPTGAIMAQKVWLSSRARPG